MKPDRNIAKGSSIKIDDLLVGENEAMHTSAAVWGMLYAMKQPYIKSLIKRLETDHCEMTEISLPIFKMIAGFAFLLQDHTNKNPRLLNALEEANIRNRMRQMFGEEDE